MIDFVSQGVPKTLLKGALTNPTKQGYVLGKKRCSETTGLRNTPEAAKARPEAAPAA
jgi:hypothetical protein